MARHYELASTVSVALWPAVTLVLLFVLELAVPLNGITAMIHQIVYGSIGFFVLYELNRVQ